jgi:pimeloyl-ACP methyl ester carboxylesterase
MRLEEARFDTAEASINYAEGPSTGPPFVLLHGGAGRWQYGQAFLDLVAEDWHVYAPDFRGHGKSGRRPNAYQLIDALIVGAAPLSTRNLATEEPTHRAQNVLWQRLDVDGLLRAGANRERRWPATARAAAARRWPRGA